jgi:hypothetical protein
MIFTAAQTLSTKIFLTVRDIATVGEHLNMHFVHNISDVNAAVLLIVQEYLVSKLRCYSVPIFCNILYEGCSESNAPHFFLGNYLLRMYEIHAQYNWMFLYICYFSTQSPSTSTALRQRETRACMPSLYQLVFCSRSHVLTDCRWSGGSQFNCW